MNLGEILERTVPPLGYELVDWDQSPRSGLVRVFIDKPQGVDVEDCAEVSTHLTHLFAVENILYERLEVSSPGLDRALKKAADFARFAGEEVKLTLRESVDNAKRMKGVLRGLDGDAVVVETETGTRAIPLAQHRQGAAGAEDRVEKHKMKKRASGSEEKVRPSDGQGRKARRSNRCPPSTTKRKSTG